MDNVIIYFTFFKEKYSFILVCTVVLRTIYTSVSSTLFSSDLLMRPNIIPQKSTNHSFLLGPGRISVELLKP